MALVEKGSDGATIVEDSFTTVADEESFPESGDILVSLDRLRQDHKDLRARDGAVGVWLRSDQSPRDLETAVEGELGWISLIALDFPTFGDGRGYSSARILRERLGFKGELRAIGDVLCEQLAFMLRSGFDTFEMSSPNALDEFSAVATEVRIVYQPTGDGQATAIDLRLGRN